MSRLQGEFQRTVRNYSSYSTQTVQGYIAMQFVAEALRKSASSNGEKLGEALRGLSITSALGPIVVSTVTQVANRGDFFGRMVGNRDNVLQEKGALYIRPPAQ